MVASSSAPTSSPPWSPLPSSLKIRKYRKMQVFRYIGQACYKYTIYKSDELYVSTYFIWTITFWKSHILGSKTNLAVYNTFLLHPKKMSLHLHINSRLIFLSLIYVKSRSIQYNFSAKPRFGYVNIGRRKIKLARGHTLCMPPCHIKHVHATHCHTTLGHAIRCHGSCC
jgi:hypothetical protein